MPTDLTRVIGTASASMMVAFVFASSVFGLVACFGTPL
jgi:hypothetical protein